MRGALQSFAFICDLEDTFLTDFEVFLCNLDLVALLVALDGLFVKFRFQIFRAHFVEFLRDSLKFVFQVGNLELSICIVVTEVKDNLLALRESVLEGLDLESVIACIVLSLQCSIPL